jgi:hypothetical protein
MNMDKQHKISKILSGSCTPASDLLVMVEDGEITASEATAAMKRAGRNVSDVHSAAASEIDYMTRNNI